MNDAWKGTLRKRVGRKLPCEMRGQGWGMAGVLSDERAEEREVLGHSHLSKDKILFLLVYSYY